MSRLLTALRMTASSFAGVGARPRDIALAARVARFVTVMPAALASSDVRGFLAALRDPRRGRPRAGYDKRAEAQRIRRIVRAVLSLPRLWHRNTCYVRALAIYRFFPPGTADVRLHLGVETRGPQRTLHGHAWLTIDGELVEAPDDVVLGTLRELPLDPRR